MAEYCNVEYKKSRLICYLPITTSKGKVRILRAEQPVATRSVPCRKDDIVEWQISYFADGHRRMVELAELLRLAFHYDLIGEEELKELLNETKGDQEFFEEKYSISIDNSGLPEDFHGFRVLKKTVPILQKNTGGVQVWVELRHKQRGVGFQPMLFLRIPISHVSPNLVAKTAQRNQIVKWEPSTPILLDTTRAFSIASEKHNRDMIDVLRRVLGL